MSPGAERTVLATAGRPVGGGGIPDGARGGEP